MRITFFVPRCTPDNSHGRYVIELVSRLSVQHDVTIYAAAFSPAVRPVARCVFLPVPHRPAIARLATLWAAAPILRKSKSTDIVHVQGADAPVGDVITAHCCNAAMSIAAKAAGRSVRRQLNYVIGAAAERHCLTRPSTRGVIAVSHKLASEIETQYGVDHRKVAVIHNGVNTREFHPANRHKWRSQVREKLGLRARDFVVLYVGADYRLKGLVTLLKAAAQVETCNVVAAGVQADARLQQVVQSGGLADRVRFLGAVRGMASLYAAADCFALPTSYDACSLSTLEALASGLPAVTSRADGSTELLTDEVDSLVLESVSDATLLADALRRLRDDEHLRDDLGSAARETAERHSWDQVASRIADVYRDALK